MKKGIDVSHYQGQIDWPAVKAGGIGFAMIRVGWTHYEGGLTLDERFVQNIEGANAAGIPAGVYAYGYDLSPGAARISAARVIEAVKPYRLEYPVCYDQEYEEVLMALSRTQRTEICAAFLETVQKSRYYAMLYASKDWLEHWVFDEQLTDYDKWVAQYADACTYQGEFGIWQYGVMGEEGVKGQDYTIAGQVQGVAANCDVDFSYRDYPGIIREAGLNRLESAPETNYEMLYEEAVREIGLLRPKAEKYDQIRIIVNN